MKITEWRASWFRVSVTTTLSNINETNDLWPISIHPTRETASPQTGANIRLKRLRKWRGKGSKNSLGWYTNSQTSGTTVHTDQTSEVPANTEINYTRVSPASDNTLPKKSCDIVLYLDAINIRPMWNQWRSHHIANFRDDKQSTR